MSPFNSEIDSWTYDLIGNRLTNTVNAVTQNYTYFKNGSNPLNGQRLQSDSVNSYTYDNNGNMVTKTGSTFSWDPENRMAGITGAQQLVTLTTIRGAAAAKRFQVRQLPSFMMAKT